MNVNNSTTGTTEFSEALRRIFFDEGIEPPKRIYVRKSKTPSIANTIKETKKVTQTDNIKLDKLLKRQKKRFSKDRQRVIDTLVGGAPPISPVISRTDLVLKKRFYSSREWRNLRYEAIRTYGRTCMCCDKKCSPPHADHIRPKLLFPHLALSFNNIQILCEDCNMGKDWKDQTDWRPAWAKEKYPNETDKN